MKRRFFVSVLLFSLFFNMVTLYAPIHVQAQEKVWESAGTLPLPLSHFAIGIHDGKVYIVGGIDSSGRKTNVYYASILDNGNIGEWHAATSLPEARSWTSQQEAVVYNNRIYVVAGSGPRPPIRIERNTVWYADINPDGSLGSWISTTSLPDHLNSHITVQWNGRIYVFGGWTGYNWKKTVYYAEINPDGSLSSWITIASLPDYRGHNQAGTVNNGIIYQLGGQYPSVVLHDTVFYGVIQVDGTISSWSTTTSMPESLGQHTASILGDRIYVIGGFYPGSWVYSDRVFSAQIQADGTLGSWEEEPSLPESRRHHGSITYNDRLYVFGGVDENEDYVDTIFSLTHFARARALKEDVKKILEDLKSTVEKKVAHKLDKAIDHIKKSLKDKLWLDETHIDPKHGHKVFDEEKMAVKKLIDLIKEEDTPEDVKDACQTAIEKLVEADKRLAEIVYEEAQNGDSKVDKELEKCEKELSKAEEELGKGHYDKAIDHYKKAWEHAQKALKHAT